MIESGRIGRFVAAARRLMLMQVGAALLALVLAVWAVIAVWELAAERDRLRAQLDAAPESSSMNAAAPATNSATSLDNEIRAPAIMPVFIPMTEEPSDMNMLVPEMNAAAPVANQVAEPNVEPVPEQECTGANANQARCRPGRWTRPVPQRPIPRTQPEPQQPDAPATPPQSD
jgi:hypothetical protein